jgi:hypothetical protein
MYSLNETHDYLPLFNIREYALEQCIYPAIRHICSAGLHGYLVRVPCNVEDVVTADYGPKWMKDAPTNGYTNMRVTFDFIYQILMLGSKFTPYEKLQQKRVL